MWHGDDMMTMRCKIQKIGIENWNLDPTTYISLYITSPINNPFLVWPIEQSQLFDPSSQGLLLAATTEIIPRS